MNFVKVLKAKLVVLILASHHIAKILNDTSKIMNRDVFHLKI